MAADALGRSVPSLVALVWAWLLLPALLLFPYIPTAVTSPVYDARDGVHDAAKETSDRKSSHQSVSESPLCSVEGVELNCSVIMAKARRDDFQDELADLMFAAKERYLPRNIAIDAVTMIRRGNVTHTNVSIEYCGNWRDLRKLHGIFLKVRIWQGPTKPSKERFLLVSLSGENKRKNLKVKRIHVNIENINIPVSSHELMGRVTASKLPVKKGKKSQSVRYYDDLRSNEIDMSHIIPSVIPTDADEDLSRQLQSSRSDLCNFQNITIRSSIKPRTITVDFCDRLYKDVEINEVLVQDITKGTVYKQTITSRDCQGRTSELPAGQYMIKLRGDCMGEVFMTNVRNVSLPSDDSTFSQLLATDVFLYVSMPAIGVIGLYLLGLILFILVNRSSKSSFKRIISNMLLHLWRRKNTEKENEKDSDNQFEGVMIIACENCIVTKHLSKHLSDRGILTRNILNSEEGMKNWMDWVENSVSHSNHFVFVVTDELLRIFEERKCETHKTNKVTSPPSSSTEHCNYALMLIRHAFAKEANRKEKQVHVLSSSSQLLRRMKTLYPIFRYRRCHSYSIPFFIEGADFSEFPSIRKLTKRLQNDKRPRSQKSSCYFEDTITVNAINEDSHDEDGHLLRKTTADDVEVSMNEISVKQPTPDNNSQSDAEHSQTDDDTDDTCTIDSETSALSTLINIGGKTKNGMSQNPPRYEEISGCSSDGRSKVMNTFKGEGVHQFPVFQKKDQLNNYVHCSPLYSRNTYSDFDESLNQNIHSYGPQWYRNQERSDSCRSEFQYPVYDHHNRDVLNETWVSSYGPSIETNHNRTLSVCSANRGSSVCEFDYSHLPDIGLNTKLTGDSGLGTSNNRMDEGIEEEQMLEQDFLSLNKFSQA